MRSLTIEHETRRGLILSELQSLAARIGAFPVSEVGEEKIETQGHLDLPYYETGEAPAAANEEEGLTADVTPMESPRGGGDWRQAAMNIRDELGFHINGRKASTG